MWMGVHCRKWSVVRSNRTFYGLAGRPEVPKEQDNCTAMFNGHYGSPLENNGQQLSIFNHDVFAEHPLEGAIAEREGCMLLAVDDDAPLLTPHVKLSGAYSRVPPVSSIHFLIFRSILVLEGFREATDCVVFEDG